LGKDLTEKVKTEIRMKVAYVTTYDATTKNSDCPVGYYQAQALRAQGISLHYLGPLKGKFWRLYSAKRRFYNHFQKLYAPERDRLLIRQYAREVAEKLSGLDVDLVFSPVGPGSQPVAYLQYKRPIVIWPDCTIKSVIDWYPYFSNVCRETHRDAIANERAVLSRCQAAIYPSEWAAQTAINLYGMDPGKVKVIHYGPLLECDRTLDDVRTIVDSRPTNKCKLLFLGRNWGWKGGEIAVQVAEELNSHGLQTELTIAGCWPTMGRPLPRCVRVVGYIDKTTREGLREINALLAETHLLILPTRGDSFGHVFPEANSFGVPCVTTDVGGVPTAVRDGVNGKTIPVEAPISEYCIYISGLMSHYDRYRELALASFHEFESRLNWSVAGAEVKRVLTEIAGRVGLNR
jgi:glycosyltransferase involved in cell wall biosynthesis